MARLRLLCDENVARQIVLAPREEHDVAWSREIAMGRPDEAVGSTAEAEGRILVTMDQDFAAAFAAKTQVAGVILVRPDPLSVRGTAELLRESLAGEGQWVSFLSVIQPGRVRQRPVR